MGKGWNNSSWNRAIFAGYAKELIDEHAPNLPGSAMVDESFIIAELFGKLRTSRGVWSKSQPHPGETIPVAQARIGKQITDHAASNKMNGRKKTVRQAL